MELGLVYTPVMAIPPRETAFVLTGYCTDKCTNLVSGARPAPAAPSPRLPGEVLGGGVSKEGRLRGFGSPTLQLCRSPPPTHVCRGDFLWASLSRDSLAPTWSTPRASQCFPALHLKLCFHSVSKIDVHSPLTVQALQGQREPPTAAAPAPLPPDSQTINCYMSLYVMSESK